MKNHLSEAQLKDLTKRRQAERRAARQANAREYPAERLAGLVTEYDGQEFLVG